MLTIGVSLAAVAAACALVSLGFMAGRADRRWSVRLAVVEAQASARVVSGYLAASVGVPAHVMRASEELHDALRLTLLEVTGAGRND